MTASAPAPANQRLLLRWILISLVIHVGAILLTSVPYLIGLATSPPAPAAEAVEATEPPSAPATTPPTSDDPAPPAQPTATPLPVKPKPTNADDAYQQRLKPATAQEQSAVEDFRPDLDALR